MQLVSAALLLLLGTASGVLAQTGLLDSPPVTARIILAQDGVPQGTETLSGAVELRLESGWKTYWRSPGEVGLPPSFNWDGSSNLKDAKHLWPAPKRFRAFGIENFGYEDRVAFPVQFTLDKPGQPVRLALSLDLLVCSDICVPETLELSRTLPVGGVFDPAAARALSDALASVPADVEPPSVDAVTAYVDPDMTELIVEITSSRAFGTVDIFPELGEGTIFGRPDIRLGAADTVLWARFPINSVGPWPEPLTLTLTDATLGAFTVPPVLLSAPPAPPYAPETSDRGTGALLWFAMIALAGGLILNVMPCVLPVLGIKVSTLVTAGRADQATVRMSLLASTLGILLFMWMLAAALVALKYLGVTVGWGIQFQSPVFLIIVITVLVVFIGNLFGAFEISMPSQMQTKIVGASHAGDVFSGFFAAMLATPCSAPLLGTAVAFALAGRGLDIVVVFTALGLGMALPYLLLAFRPGWAARLPKPGSWMLGVRYVLGVLLAGTVAWLAWVMVGVAGPRATVATLVAALVVTALLACARHYSRGLIAAAIPVLVLTFLLVPTLDDQRATTVIAEAQASNWIAFDPASISRHVSRGHIVFVDVTADWCVTCKANKVLVIDRDPVAPALREDGVFAMQADWTKPDERIAQYLESNNRFGIPFNAIYGPGAPEGIILPEILRQGLVMDALNKAKPLDLRARLIDLSTR